MLRLVALTLTLSTLLTVGWAQNLSSGTWIDLTHTLNEDAVFWPTADKFKKTTVAEGHTEGGYYYSSYNFSASEHGGTHLDAPVHFAEGMHSTDEIPLEQLIGPAVVIDVSERAATDRDYQISVEDITAWEGEHGELPEGAIVLFKTGFGQYYPDLEQYLGTAERGPEAVADLHFPGIHPDAATFLATERTIDAVGLDTASLDYGQSTLFGSHVALNTHNIPGLENVANLEALPPTGATVIALPMKTEGGSGGPVRIVAYLPEE
jgi:kynurenine formamidase